MIIYGIRHIPSGKLISVSSKHRKFYVRKINAIRAIQYSYYKHNELELAELEVRDTTLDVGSLKLGDYVEYDSYYVKDKNGIYIETNSLYNPEETIDWAISIDKFGNRVDLDFEGDGILKPLYRLKHSVGKGYVVDINELVVDEYLYCDTTTLYNGSERKIICKNPVTTVNCVRVAYSLGKTRWVPLSSITLQRSN